MDGLDRHARPAICAAAIIALGVALTSHEGAHVLVGWLVGGSPTMITALEVRGDFTALTGLGYIGLGLAGYLANVFLCLGALWILRRPPLGVESRLLWWFAFSVNGSLAATKMVAEAIAGWGDMATVLRGLPSPTAFRVLVALVGLVGTVYTVRGSGAELRKLIPPGERAQRTRAAFELVLIGAAAGAVLLVGAGLGSQLGAVRGGLLALGAGVGGFVPMIFGVRVIPREAHGYSGPAAMARWPWVAGAGVTALIIWLGFGPGIAL